MKKEEYFTVGEMARRMKVSVRTLQYYDREGLLEPSALSEGGRRLYTYRDMVLLHQILSLKHLGFSLAEIREKLLPLKSPEEVAQVLSSQAAAVRSQMANLQQMLSNIERLRDEVLSMHEVDFQCYADIVVNLEMHNDLYWALKFLEPEARNRIREQFDHERGRAFLHEFEAVLAQAALQSGQGQAPAGPEAQQTAAQFWQLVQAFTGGDADVLNALMSMREVPEFAAAWKDQTAAAFLESALGIYLETLGLSGREEDGNDGTVSDCERT